MRRGKNGGICWGWVAIAAGVIIILALVLTTSFWWFLFAAGIIAVGIWYLRCC